MSAVMALMGCTTGADLAKQRAAREYDCAITDVEVEWVKPGPGGSDVYRTHACGKVVTYVCDELDATCIRKRDEAAGG